MFPGKVVILIDKFVISALEIVIFTCLHVIYTDKLVYSLVNWKLVILTGKHVIFTSKFES